MIIFILFLTPNKYDFYNCFMKEEAVIQNKYKLLQLKVAKGYNQTWIAET